MYVHEALPYPSKGGCRSMLAHGAISMQTVGRTSPPCVVAVDDGSGWWQHKRGERATHHFALVFRPFIPHYQCLAWAHKGPLMVMDKKIPIKLRPHHSIPLTGPRPVFPVWSLTIHQVPCSLKAPGDHRHGMSPSLLLFLFPGLHQEVFIKCQSDKWKVIFYCELFQPCSGAQIYSLRELLTAYRREL